VLSRAACAGAQRFGAVWSGDNCSTWGHLRLSLTMALNTGVSGLPFCGPDIGGFGGRPTAELFLRWLQLGAFFGFMRVHTCEHTPDQEPWSFGPQWEHRNRRAIELRYRLLPYIYSLAHEASELGLPLLRPLWFEFPEVQDLGCVEDQFLLGSQLLGAPALEPDCRFRRVCLPPGRWFGFSDGQPARTGTITVATPLDQLPLLARAGALIPLQAVIQHTQQKPDPTLVVRTFVGQDGSFDLIEDAGDGPALGGAARRRTRLTLQTRGRALQLAAELEEADHPAEEKP